MRAVQAGAAGETLQQGQWRSSLTIQRLAGNSSTWELADRVELGGASLDSPHGLGGAPVFGTLVWAAPMPWAPKQLQHCWREHGMTARA